MPVAKRVAGRFELDRLVGAGGMGAVWRALDRETGEPVALKRMRGCEADEASRFAREAELLSGLTHDAVVRHVAHGCEDDGSLYLAMEWLDGVSLAARLRDGPLSITDTIELAARLAQALGAAHDAGVVHRDVKPSNVMLVGGEVARAKLLDFGIARQATSPLITVTGIAVGTPGYMAPEQARGAKAIAPCADVFGLGCVLFHCLTGTPPFAAAHTMAVLAKLILEEPMQPSQHRPGVPADLDALVARMLEKRPALRPIDGNAVARELCALRTGDGAAPAAPAAVGRLERRSTCVVFAAAPSVASERDAGPDSTTRVRTGRWPHGQVQATAERYGGAADELADGTLLVTIAAREEEELASAADEPARCAALCALELLELLPDARFAIALVHADPSKATPMGGALDRAAQLCQDALAGAPGAIVLDEVCASLLSTRFHTEQVPGGHRLVRERDPIGPARTVLGRATPHVGRRLELSTLRAVYRECVQEGVARAAVITGPAGAGKTRLAAELVAAISSGTPAPFVLHGRGEALARGSRFGVIAGAVRRALRVRTGEPESVRSTKVRRFVGRAVAEPERSRVVEFLGEMIGAVEIGAASTTLRAARADPRIMGDQLRGAFEQLLDAECRLGPVVFVIEDAHFCDRPSLELCGALLRNLGERPLFMLALSRPDAEEVGPNLWPGSDLLRIRLPPLSRTASMDLARALLPDAPEALLDRIAEHAGGNVFYLEELVRSVARAGEEQWPTTVLAMVEARLVGLDPELRRALRAASVFGNVFWSGGVAALLGSGPRSAATRELLAGLVERELCAKSAHSRFVDEDEYVFSHELVREAAYRMLPDDDRQVGHRLAGLWLEEHGDAEAVRVAAHHASGGNAARAVAAWARAAEQALEADDLRAAEEHALRGVAAGASGATLGALLSVQAEVAQHRGDAEAARRLASEALQVLPRGERAHHAAMVQAALASFRIGDVARLEVLAETLESELDGGARADSLVVAAARVAICLEMAARGVRAGELLARAEKALSQTSDGRAGAWLARAGAFRALSGGDLGAYLRLELTAAEQLERIGAARDALSARVNTAFGWLSLGAADEAERTLRGALAGATRLGLTQLVATALWNLGFAREEQGDAEEAVELYQRALEAAGDDRRVAIGARIELSRVLAERGELEGAEREARQAVAMAAGTAQRVRAQATLADVLTAGGDVAGALAAAQEARAALGDASADTDGDATARLALARALDASGDRSAALATVEEARSRLLARAARIGEPRWRQSFLQRVTEHRRTLELADAWRTRAGVPSAGAPSAG